MKTIGSHFLSPLEAAEFQKSVWHSAILEQPLLMSYGALHTDKIYIIYPSWLTYIITKTLEDLSNEEG